MTARIVRLLAAGAMLGALAVIPPAASFAGGGCHGDTAIHHGDTAIHSDAASSVVGMDVCAFAPTVARVPVGAEVRFVNKSEITHIVAGEPAEWGNSRELRAGQDFRRRFERPGIYPYSCPLHPGMVGAVVVGDAANANVAVAVPTPTTAVDVPATPVAATGDPGVTPAVFVAVAIAGAVGGLGIAGVLATRRRREG